MECNATLDPLWAVNYSFYALALWHGDNNPVKFVLCIDVLHFFGGGFFTCMETRKRSDGWRSDQVGVCPCKPTDLYQSYKHLNFIPLIYSLMLYSSIFVEDDSDEVIFLLLNWCLNVFFSFWLLVINIFDLHTSHHFSLFSHHLIASHVQTKSSKSKFISINFLGEVEKTFSSTHLNWNSTVFFY